MRIRSTTRIAMAAGVLTLIAGVATGGGTAHAATAGSASVSAAPQSLSFVSGGQPNGVAATAAGSAWAVGSTGLLSQRTLILHWNGKSWS